MKRGFLLLALCLMLLGALPLAAQEDDADTLPPERLSEMLDTLLPYFPFPEWSYNIAANPTEILINVDEVQGFPIVSYLQQWVEESYTPGELDAMTDKAWLDVVMEGYPAWTETARCTDDTHLLVEMTAGFDGDKYVASYWTWQDGDALASFFAAYDLEHQPDFEEMAASQFPALPNCAAQE